MTVQCAFCGSSIATKPLSLVVRSAVSGDAAQELFAHGSCLASALDKSVTFDEAVFED
jgi:hypothetical protein